MDEKIIEHDIEKMEKYDEPVQVIEGKYLFSSEDLYKIFLGLLSLEMFSKISVSNARLLCIKNKKEVIAGLDWYIEGLQK